MFRQHVLAAHLEDARSRRVGQGESGTEIQVVGEYHVSVGKRPALPPLAVPLSAAKAKPGDCPFAHPRYWAAFILIGHAE